jgi:hypothetical protein
VSSISNLPSLIKESITMTESELTPKFAPFLSFVSYWNALEYTSTSSMLTINLNTGRNCCSRKCQTSKRLFNFWTNEAALDDIRMYVLKTRSLLQNHQGSLIQRPERHMEQRKPVSESPVWERSGLI